MLNAPQDTEFTEELFSQLTRLSQFLIFFWIAYNLMKFEWVGEQTWSLFGVACVLLAILQAAGVVSTEVGQQRMSTFGDNPNVLASMLGIGLLSLVGLSYGRHNIETKVRWFVWLTAGLLLLGMVRTGSRGNLLAFVLALMVLTVRPSTLLARMKTVLIGVVVLITIAAASYQIQAVRERWERTLYERDVALREELVPTAWEMFLEKPLLGWGPVVHAAEMAARMGRNEPGDPHNVYLWVLIETGLWGAGFFIIGLWLCWRSVWHARKSVHGSLPLALLVFLLAINLKGTYLYYKVFWVVLAYALASGSYAVVATNSRLHAFPALVKLYGGRQRLRQINASRSD
jgi:O-antigen ligase